jgi:hypothetical protein
MWCRRAYFLGKHASWAKTVDLVFFFEMKAKELPHWLIKKKRIAQLINGKPGKNYYNKDTDTCRLLSKHETPRPPLHTNKHASQHTTTKNSWHMDQHLANTPHRKHGRTKIKLINKGPLTQHLKKIRYSSSYRGCLL